MSRPAGPLLRDTGRNGRPRGRSVRRSRTGARGARARARHGARRASVRRSSSPGTRASARPGSPPSSRTRPCRRVRDPARTLASISSARSCRTSRSSRRCVRSETPWQVDGRRPARSCGYSRTRSRCSPSAPLRRPCCSCSRMCTGRTPRRSISSSSWRTTSGGGGFCFSRRAVPTSPRSADRVRRLAEGVRRSGPRSCSSSGRSSRGRAEALLAGRADAPPPPALIGRDRQSVRGESLLRQGAPRRCRRARPRSSRMACATCCCNASPGSIADAGRAAPGGGRRARGRVSAALRNGGAPGARPARLAPPGGGARRAGGRAGDGTLPVPPCAAGGGDLRDDPAGGARGAPRAARRGARRERSGRSGRAGAALGGGGSREERRSPPRSRQHARRRPSSASRRLTPISSGRSRSGTPCRTRPSSPGSTSPSSAPGRPSSPAKSVPPCARSSSLGGRSSSSARTTRTVRRSSTCASASTSTRPAAKTLDSPRSSARSSSCRRSRPRRCSRIRWRRSRGR